MKKVIIASIVTIMICMPVLADNIYKLTQANYPVYIDGQALQSDLPILKYTFGGGDNTYIPLRVFLEATGAKVDWKDGRVDISATELKFNDIKKLTDKCVMIKVYKDGKYSGQGSGVILGDVIITCKHVLNFGDVYKVCYNNSIEPNLKEYEAKKIKEDKKLDVGIIKNPNKEYTGIEIGDSSIEKVKYGDPAIVIGSPYGTKNMVSFGYISGFLPVDEKGRYICFSGDVNFGNSGGALINARNGTLIGIVNQTNHGTYFQTKDTCAIPINDIKPFLSKVEK